MSQKFYSDIEVKAGLRDSSGSLGASGQILSSTSGNVSWVTPTVNTVARDVQNEVKAGVAITKGQAVYVTGANGTNIIVGLASNTSEATSSKTLGLLNATVSVNGSADVVQIGRLSGLNTIGATAGDPVWLGTNGNLIYGLANKPYAPAHLVFLGIVTRVNANNGEIFINVQNGFELNEIHDVDLKTNVPINGDILGYDGTLWVNKTIAEWLGYTPANASGTTNYVSKFTGANTLENSQIFDNGSFVGVNTTNPTTTLEVSGIDYSFSAGRQAANRKVSIGLNNNGQPSIQGFSSINKPVNLTINPSGGNVGIGTLNPNYTTAGRTTIDINGSSQSMLALSVGGVGKSFLFYTGTDLLVSNESNGSIKFNTNGSEKAIITSGGNVGIGTSSPSAKLHVAGEGVFDDNTLGRLTLGFASSQNDIYSTTTGFGAFKNLRLNANELILSTGGTNERMRITSTGNVGIGTTSPGTRLHVNKSESGSNPSAVLRLENTGSAYTSKMTLTDGVTNDANISYIGATQSLSFGIGTSLNQMILNPSGNVGIGTIAPQSKFVVSNNNNEGIEFLPGSSGINKIFSYDRTSSLWKDLGIYGNDLIFNVNGTSETMRITSTGNVGIGTTNPSYTLDIVSSNPRLRIKDSGTGYSILDIEGGAGSFYVATDNSAGSVFGSAYGRYLYSTGAYPMVFVTNSSERMRITSGGNVGIGTSAPSTSAILHLNSTSKGFLPPVMNQSERDSIGAPKQGLMIFNIDTETVDVFTIGGGWKSLLF